MSLSRLILEGIVSSLDIPLSVWFKITSDSFIGHQDFMRVDLFHNNAFFCHVDTDGNTIDFSRTRAANQGEFTWFELTDPHSIPNVIKLTQCVLDEFRLFIPIKNSGGCAGPWTQIDNQNCSPFQTNLWLV